MFLLRFGLLPIMFGIGCPLGAQESKISPPATDGKDDHEAMEEAINALGSDLSIRLSRKEEIPAPSAVKRGQRSVPVPVWLAPKLTLFPRPHSRRRQL
jgi:hypothetical protein